MYQDDTKGKEYFGQILSIIKQNTTQESPVVVIGPGFTRDHFLSYGKEHDPELFSACVTCGTGHAGMNGVHEAIKVGVVDQITKHHRVSMETQLIDQFFSEIQKHGCATYGAEDVKQALKQGAVEHLLIADAIIRSSRGEKLLDLARTMHSDFTIINTMHEAGKTFMGIGGIGALLRYKL
jgi:stalled ribosome rescue protein Dom34